MTKKEKIELLLKVIKGEIPASKLKQYELMCFLYMSKEQHIEIESVTGPVVNYKSEYMPKGETVIGLFEGLPVGFTGWWHLAMVWHPDSTVKLIDGRNTDNYTQFITKLKKQYEKR